LTTSKSATLILVSRADVGEFLAASFETGRVICLTPVARHLLEADGRIVKSCSTCFGERGHRRGLVRARRIEHYLDAVFGHENHLNAGSQEALRQSLLNLTAVAARTWHTIGAMGPWVIYDGDAWRELDDRWEATALLLKLFRSQFYFARHKGAKYVPARGSSLFAFLNGILARLLRGMSFVLIVKPGRGMQALIAEIQSISSETMIVNVAIAKRGFGAYRSVLANIRTLLLVAMGKEISEVMLVRVPITRPAAAVARSIDTALDGIPDRLVRRAALLFKDDLIEFHLLIQGLSGNFKRFMDQAKPRSAVLWNTGSGMYPAIAWAAEQRNVPCWVLASTSVSLPRTGSTSQFAATLFAKYIGVSSLTRGAIVQSPAAQRVTQHAVPDQPLIRCQPIVWRGRNLQMAENPARRSARRDRVILYVGNFCSWYDYRPWVMETADEFARSIVDLARVAATIKNCRLVIRSKSKPDLDFDAMEYFVSDLPNCEIQASRDIVHDCKLPSLGEAVADADLVIGFSTTVLEEAIHAGCPVLLWGGRQRYQHLQARFTPPSRGDRAAVYSVKREKDLRPMLGAVLDAHEGDRLSEEEMQDYCWPRNVPGVSSLARMLLDGGDAFREC
jgi:hypothetical protein